MILTSIDAANNKRYLEIWRGIRNLNNTELYYCLNPTNIYELSDSLSLFAIADVDRNGLLDLIFPLLANSDRPKILVSYNKLEFINEWDLDYCKAHSNPSTVSPSVFDPLLFTIDTVLITFILL